MQALYKAGPTNAKEENILFLQLDLDLAGLDFKL